MPLLHAPLLMKYAKSLGSNMSCVPHVERSSTARSHCATITIMMRECGPFLIALVAFMALFLVLFEGRCSYEYYGAAPQTKEVQRALRLTKYLGHPLNTTLTVVLAKKRKEPRHYHSAFQTHLLLNYGSGRLDYSVHDKAGR